MPKTQSRDPNILLREAIQRGNPKKVKQCLTLHGLDINGTAPYDEVGIRFKPLLSDEPEGVCTQITPIHYTVILASRILASRILASNDPSLQKLNNYLGIIRHLIAAGADLEKPDNMGETPLFSAYLFKQWALCDVLLGYGAKIACHNIYNRNLLFFPGPPDPSQSLVYKAFDRILAGEDPSQQLDVNQPDVRGNRPVHIHAFNGRMTQLQWLFERGADFTLLNQGGRIPLIDFLRSSEKYNMSEGCLQGLTQLLEMTPALPDALDASPLVITLDRACFMVPHSFKNAIEFQLFELLLESPKISVNALAKDTQGRKILSAMDTAMFAGRIDIVEKLVAKGALLSANPGQPDQLMRQAIASQASAAVQYCLGLFQAEYKKEHKPISTLFNYHSTSDVKVPLIICAIQAGRYDVLQIFVDNGAAIQPNTGDAEDILLGVIRLYSLRYIHFFWQQGADFLVQDKNGITAVETFFDVYHGQLLDFNREAKATQKNRRSNIKNVTPVDHAPAAATGLTSKQHDSPVDIRKMAITLLTQKPLPNEILKKLHEKNKHFFSLPETLSALMAECETTQCWKNVFFMLAANGNLPARLKISPEIFEAIKKYFSQACSQTRPDEPIGEVVEILESLCFIKIWADHLKPILKTYRAFQKAQRATQAAVVETSTVELSPAAETVAPATQSAAAQPAITEEKPAAPRESASPSVAVATSCVTRVASPAKAKSHLQSQPKKQNSSKKQNSPNKKNRWNPWFGIATQSTVPAVVVTAGSQTVMVDDSDSSSSDSDLRSLSSLSDPVGSDVEHEGLTLSAAGVACDRDDDQFSSISTAVEAVANHAETRRKETQDRGTSPVFPNDWEGSQPTQLVDAGGHQVNPELLTLAAAPMVAVAAVAAVPAAPARRAADLFPLAKPYRIPLLPTQQLPAFYAVMIALLMRIQKVYGGRTFVFGGVLRDLVLFQNNRLVADYELQDIDIKTDVPPAKLRSIIPDLMESKREGLWRGFLCVAGVPYAIDVTYQPKLPEQTDSAMKRYGRDINAWTADSLLFWMDAQGHPHLLDPSGRGHDDIVAGRIDFVDRDRAHDTLKENTKQIVKMARLSTKKLQVSRDQEPRYFQLEPKALHYLNCHHYDLRWNPENYHIPLRDLLSATKDIRALLALFEVNFFRFFLVPHLPRIEKRYLAWIEWRLVERQAFLATLAPAALFNCLLSMQFAAGLLTTEFEYQRYHHLLAAERITTPTNQDGLWFVQHPIGPLAYSLDRMKIYLKPAIQKRLLENQTATEPVAKLHTALVTYSKSGHVNEVSEAEVVPLKTRIEDVLDRLMDLDSSRARGSSMTSTASAMTGNRDAAAASAAEWPARVNDRDSLQKGVYEEVMSFCHYQHWSFFATKSPQRKYVAPVQSTVAPPKTASPRVRSAALPVIPRAPAVVIPEIFSAGGAARVEASAAPPPATVPAPVPVPAPAAKKGWGVVTVFASRQHAEEDEADTEWPALR